ncbi:MAG: ABC transporter permease [Polyangiaceae bacterium]|jgi:lipoprotein-releasing system permease protein|nr:ABC transporter permease [Polyangiaceae bacterium]
MGYPLRLAVRYLGSKKRASISVGTAFAILGVALGVAALLTVMSVTGGFQAEFREKVLGVNAHVLVLKHSPEFRNYREIMDRVRGVKGVMNVAPFSINPMMLSHGEKTATGVLVKGVDPQASLGVGLPPEVPPVLDLPRHVIRGEAGECPKPSDLACGIGLLAGLRREGAMPPAPKIEPIPTGDVPPFPSPEPPPVHSDATSPDAGDADAGDADAGGHAAPVIRDAMRYYEKQGGSKPADPPADEPAVDAKAKDAAGKSTTDKGGTDKGAAKDAAKDAKEPDAKDEPPADAKPAPEGEVTPEGGYTSKLPEDDDEVLKDLVKDPCDDAELVKKLPGIVVGVSLAENLDLKLGTCVTVSSPTIGFQFSGGAVKAPVAKSFRVMAMFEAGFDQYDSKLVYTDLYEAQEFYDEGDTVTGVEMKIADIDKSDDVVEAVRAALPGCSDDACGYRIMDWKELNHGLFTALLIQQIGMSGVLALIILVAAFTVVATLIMVVLDKKKEISVLKAMGASDSAILRVFLYQGGIIGGLGTSLGLLIGFGVCRGLLVWAFPLDPKVYFISQLPVLMRWQEFAITGAVALTLCLLATVIPSLYAANIRPAEGFREQ